MSLRAAGGLASARGETAGAAGWVELTVSTCGPTAAAGTAAAGGGVVKAGDVAAGRFAPSAGDAPRLGGASPELPGVAEDGRGCSGAVHGSAAGT